MNRRRLLVALGGLGLTGTSAWVLGDGLGSSGSSLPLTVETFDAPGSEAGEMRVPAEGTVTVVDLFATWCSPCKEQMDALGAVREEYGDEVAMISVTNERLGGGLSKGDIRDWWRENDGAWTLGHDPDSELMSALGAGGIPHVAVFDAEGEVAWAETGVTDAKTLRKQVEEALA
ncbi:TlpA family protein disulfide reductase [Halorussus ruber]|uniref:TlpA family protein disulfide reductase n=1 Tax=Halorussus ruber TaxID=1126238 RepID=UPI00109276D7|nr:TlpA disulfide reductase family protein [Halorussus ruber]